MNVDYTFEIVSPKYGRFVVAAPSRFRKEIETRTWQIAYDKRRADGSQFSVKSNKKISGKAVGTQFHRFIWALMGKAPVREVDHVDRNPLNNSEENLRDGSEGNPINRSRQRNNKSGLIGVSWRQGKWCAQIKNRGAVHHLGNFSSKHAAAAARDAAARRLHGEFAVLNSNHPAPAKVTDGPKETTDE